MFSNLLNNAAKYSPGGTPIELVARASHGSDVEVAVIDSGIGLAPGQADEIFEAFAQIDTSLERSRGGLGIGLTLVKRIVELHGGHIVAHSEGLGQGSRFSVLSAARADSGGVGASGASAQRRRRTCSCRALIVDDNHDSADTMAMMLKMLGHETHCVYDPRQTTGAVETFVPDVVFLDIGMPGLSGYDVARSLRSRASGARS